MELEIRIVDPKTGREAIRFTAPTNYADDEIGLQIAAEGIQRRIIAALHSGDLGYIRRVDER